MALTFHFSPRSFSSTHSPPSVSRAALPSTLCLMLLGSHSCEPKIKQSVAFPLLLHPHNSKLRKSQVNDKITDLITLNKILKAMKTMYTDNNYEKHYQ